MTRDIGASLRFKWRAPWGGALPGESLKSYARRLANTTHRLDNEIARTWLERKGCRWVNPLLPPIRAPQGASQMLYDTLRSRANLEQTQTKSDVEKSWRERAHG